MDQLALSFLGSFQIRLNGALIEGFESDKARGLLAFLAVEAEQPHRRTRLAGLLWPDMPETRALRNLNQALYNIRRALKERHRTPAFILSSRATIQFNPASSYRLDVSDFCDRLEAIHTHDHPGLENCGLCIERLRQSVSFYRGEFLGGFFLGDCQEFDEWILVTRERLQRMALEALHQLSDHYERTGELTLALQHAWQQVEIEPLGEEGNRQLIRLLAQAGQRNAALMQYEHFRRTLLEELGVAPEQRTVELHAQIQVVEQAPEVVPVQRHNLPTAITPFIGRRSELGELQSLLGEPTCRLLTVAGPGGSGKTRLALEAAQAQLGKYAHGVYFVSLDPIQEIETIIPATAQALRFPLQEGRDPGEQLLDYLRTKELLLVMDSFEHLPGGADFVVQLLQAAPRVKVLATSRARLGVKGEQLYPLGGMQVPAEIQDEAGASQSEAIQLFLSGARRSQPAYQPTSAELPEFIDICHQVQGMPLAILLAASWMGTFTPREILGEIRSSLDFLQADWCDLPKRQRSLRATFDYSWQLLSQREREIFQALAVCRGGFTAQAAQQVAQARPGELRALVEKSFLQRGLTGRYELHELMRQYGVEKLAHMPSAYQAANERHCTYYLGALQRWEAGLKSTQQALVLAEMDVEYGNLHAAWRWATAQGRREQLERALDGLSRYFDLHMRFQEGARACQAATGVFEGRSSSGEDLKIKAHILTWESYFNCALSNEDRVRACLEESQALVDQATAGGLDARREQAAIHYVMGKSVFRHDRKAAQDHYRRGLQIYRQLDDPWETAGVLHALAHSLLQAGEFEGAKELLAECIALQKEIGDRRGLAASLRIYSFVHVRQGQFEQALQLMEESSAIYQSIGDQVSIAKGLRGLGLILGWHGRFAEAVELLSHSLPYLEELGHGIDFVYLLLGMAKALLGEYREAQAYAETGLSLARENGAQRNIAVGLMVLGWIALAEGARDGARGLLLESVSTYRQVKMLDELGWALASLACAERHLGQSQHAWEHAGNALAIATQIRGAMSAGFALSAIALLLGDQGEAERAVELYALASQLPMIANAQWFEEIVGKEIESAAACLPPEIVTAARERGQRRELFAIAEALLGEFWGQPD